MSNTRYAILLSGFLFFTNFSNAQNSPIAVSPVQLTFNTIGNAAPPAQNLLVTSTSNSSASFSLSTFSSGNWLSVTPASGNTPQVLSVSVNPASLTAGAYGGFIVITSGGTSTIVPVTLNVNSGGQPAFTSSPGSLTFNFQTGSNIPQSQTVSVSSAGGGNVTFSAGTATSNGGAWLSVNPSSGTTPNAPLVVSVNPTNLQAGSYAGFIAINTPGMTGLLIPVQVNVAPPATVNVTPSQLSFAFQLGTSAPPAQTLNVTSTGGGTIAFTATPSTSSCGNWLVVSPQSSATPAAVSVQVNTVSLQAGNCSGTINISAPGASNPSISVPVSLLVSTNPLLQVPTSPVMFNYQLLSATPAAQTVQVTSSSTPLAFNVTATPVSGGPNFLTVSPTSGTTPQAIMLSLNPAVLMGLAPNTYAENVTVSSAGAGNPPQTFTVTLVVSNNATLVASQGSLTFNYQIGQSAPPSQTITVSSTGPPLGFQVTTSTTNCSGFLSASPATGLTATQQGQQTAIAVSVNTAGLTTPQTCTGTVTISAPATSNPPLTISTTLNVSNTALLNVSPSAVTVVAVAGTTTMLTQPISLTSTDGSALSITATAVTNPPGLTWLSVTPQTGSTPMTLNVTVNSAGLSFGTYTASINISSPNVPAQSVPVTLIVASGTIGVTPSSLSFSQPIGGSAPPSQTIQVTGVPAGATVGAAASMLNGANWLNASISGSTITVSVNGSQLTQGTYSGVITVIVPGASNSPFYVPVTFTVGGAPLFTLTPATINFAFQQNTNLPPPQTIQLTSTGNISFSAVAVAPPGTAGGPVFITVTPTSGTTPANLSISLIPSVVNSLSPGTYTNFINLSSNPLGPSQTMTVTLVVTPPGPPAVLAVVNSASLLTGPISPGEIITIFGSNIGPSTPVGLQLTSNGMVATTLGNTSVTLNGVKAPLIYVSQNQINAIAPYEIAGLTSVNVVVTTGSMTSASFPAPVTTASPAIFTFGQNGTGQGAILNQDLSVNGANNAAARGSVIAIYGTGEGATTPASVTGSVTTSTPPFPRPMLPVTVTIGGVQAVTNYVGEAPSLVAGVIQVNAIVPSNIAPGNQTVVLTIGGISSPAVVTAAIK